MPGQFKRMLLGQPLHNEQMAHQRLSNFVALPVFASDALSSVAYATEEILLVLALVGTGALGLSVPIAAAIGTLLVIVVFSYRQTIKAYPSGGGAYIVAKENLGDNPGLVAGGSLLVDYILTVAVSISAGTAAITSALPSLLPYTVVIAVTFVVILTMANLRGLRESGAVFAGPTYFFVFMLGLLIVVGVFKFLTGQPITAPRYPSEAGATQALTLFIILRAFASGCTAMTGVEAVANGVQAFKSPESRNANKTLMAMAGILLFLFLGTTFLSQATHAQPSAGVTIVSMISEGVFGRGVFYYLLQAATAAILVLAANTSYADFPRLGSFMAADGFLPRQLKDRGSKLVYSNGMLLLAAVSIVLIVAFGGITAALIPLYAVGVFTSFTLSQAGMVVHWWKLRETGWKRSMVINGFGSVATGVVTLIIGYTKFAYGAWIVIVLIPILVLYFKWVKSHYDSVDRRLRLPEGELVRMNWQAYNRMHNHVVLLVSNVDRRLVRAVQYARTLKSDSIEAIYVDVGGDKAESMRRIWQEAGFGIRLTIIDSPYRELMQPIREYVRSIPRKTSDWVVTVILPEFVPESIPDYMLHDQTPFLIKQALFQEPGVIVVDVPYHLGEDSLPEPIRGRKLATATPLHGDDSRAVV
jgi:amino acid transporter